MMKKPLIPILISVFGGVFLLSGCVTKRTVIENGRVVEEKNVVKRPVKNLIENTEFE